MRFHYMSDLHLESQEFSASLPQGEALIIAGDLCHAACLDPARSDLYAVRQRDRVARFIDKALASFKHVLLIAGNHDHYDGFLEDTAETFRRALPGVVVLDNSAVDVGGVEVYGTTLWSDFEGGSETSLAKTRRGCGEFFFVKTRSYDPDAKAAGVRFQPVHALAEHRRSLSLLATHLDVARGRTTVIVSHHAPSLKGLNEVHRGKGLDGAYASDLDGLIARLSGVPYWVHGHTHVRRRYKIGETTVVANCRGFEGRDGSARGFSVRDHFDAG